MTTLQMNPVFCSHCETFALAELAGRPMCWNCLFSAVGATGHSRTDIMPLESETESSAKHNNATQQLA